MRYPLKVPKSPKLVTAVSSCSVAGGHRASVGIAPTPFRGVALDYQGGYHREKGQEERNINRRNELLAVDVKDYEIDKEHYDDVDYLDWLVSCIRSDLGIPEPRLSSRSRASWRERRVRLCEELAAADGLHWTGRKRGLIMAGAADFKGEALP